MKALPNFFPHLCNIFKNELSKVSEGTFADIFKHYKDKVLGTGSHGTKVYKGNFQGRPIAIKQVLKSLSTTVKREAAIMLKVDQHPNILRYFAKEEDDNFIYLGTELCECSLTTLITGKGYDGIKKKMESKKILKQTAEGLDHLHKLNISK